MDHRVPYSGTIAEDPTGNTSCARPGLEPGAVGPWTQSQPARLVAPGAERAIASPASWIMSNDPMVPDGGTLAGMDLPAMCPAALSVGQSAGRLNQCWMMNGWGFCPKAVDPEGIGLCPEHLEELRDG